MLVLIVAQIEEKMRKRRGRNLNLSECTMGLRPYAATFDLQTDSAMISFIGASSKTGWPMVLENR